MSGEVLANVTGGPWSPLRIAMYRSLWIAALVSNVGTFMHIVAAGWAMTSLTDSPTLVGLVQTSWAVPGFVLALHAGAFADMVELNADALMTQAAAATGLDDFGPMDFVERLEIILQSLDTEDWLRPMDIGGGDASYHSAVLRTLVRKGLVERRRRNTLRNALNSRRGSYEYRRKA